MTRSRRVAAGSLIFALALSALTGGAEAARYGLVVGIDAYLPPIPRLHGAVADARDIASALERSGADRVVLLTDAQASKAAIRAAYDDLLAGAAAGDTLVFAYAGHGSQEPARPGDPEEPDGFDETFPLSGFAYSGPGLAERIVDNEIAEWLHRAEARKVHVVFVADACHSGTMYRSVSLGLTTRAAPRLTIDRAQLLAFAPPAPIAPEAIGEDEDVTFIAGVSDDRLVPEVAIDGAERGALSYAFARALEGAADADRDDVVTERELTVFVRATVQQRTESQQVPQSFPAVSRALPLFAGTSRGKDVWTAAAKPLLLAVRGSGPAQVPGALIVPDEARAELVYDGARRTVERRVAGIVAEGVDPAGLAGIVAKWRAIDLLKAGAAHNLVAFEVASGSRIYRRGETLDVLLVPSTQHYLTLFNLPPNGRVELLYPATPAERDADWRGRPFQLPLKVQRPPFGAEHLVALLSDRPLDALQDALRRLDGPAAAARLPDVLADALAGQAVAIGIADVFTSGVE